VSVTPNQRFISIENGAGGSRTFDSDDFWLMQERRKHHMLRSVLFAFPKSSFSRVFSVLPVTAALLIVELAMAQPGQTITHLKEPVQVTGGMITGTLTLQWTPGVRLYRGIPYAAPPVGNLRWRPPQPVVPWTGIKAADHFGSACMQAPTDTEGNAWREGLVPVSEDCLYINVWTPARTPDANLPVMVFIHGGGNFRGASSENQYDGAYLAAKGVVFVSFNYRMNVFGFLAYPGLTPESPHHSSGNYALLDQIAALTWVQANIAHFGGNPHDVMIFGHSAGSANVSTLLASPLAHGLFQRALMQSGENLRKGPTLAEAEKTGEHFAESIGAHSVADLRNMPAEELLRAAPRRMGLIVDGWVLPEDVYSTFVAGKQNDVPLIVGSVANDTPGPPMAPAKAAEVPAYAKRMFGNLADEYLKLYPSNTDEQAVQADPRFRSNRAMASARELARLQLQIGKSPVYWYWFTHTSPFPEGLMWGGIPAKDWGAYHGSEIVYVFDAFPLQDWAWRPTDLQLGNLVSNMWINFAKSGNPNGSGIPEWPAYNNSAEELLNISDHPHAQKAPGETALDFQDKVAERERRMAKP
jgi:para-nitrobenzyl esterase